MKKLDKKGKLIIIGASVLVTLVTAYIIFKYFQRNNAREVLDKKVGIQATLNLKDAFNPNRWKTGKPVISDATGRYIAQKIYNSIGYFSEDESAITTAINGVKNYDDLSVVGYQYQSLHNKDLYNAILSAYKGDNVALARLRSVIAKKIQYTPKK